MRRMREVVGGVDEERVFRRQEMTTWGILALAVFVGLGMAEWSKRTAAAEVIVDEKIFQQAIQIAAEARDSESGKRPSFAAKPLRGAASEGVADREANIQTSAGE